jgi:hypothetical protein
MQLSGGTSYFYQVLDRLDLDSLGVPALKTFVQTGGRLPEDLAKSRWRSPRDVWPGRPRREFPGCRRSCFQMRRGRWALRLPVGRFVSSTPKTRANPGVAAWRGRYPLRGAAGPVQCQPKTLSQMGAGWCQVAVGAFLRSGAAVASVTVLRAISLCEFLRFGPPLVRSSGGR